MILEILSFLFIFLIFYIIASSLVCKVLRGISYNTLSDEDQSKYITKDLDLKSQVTKNKKTKTHGSSKESLYFRIAFVNDAITSQIKSIKLLNIFLACVCTSYFFVISAIVLKLSNINISFFSSLYLLGIFSITLSAVVATYSSIVSIYRVKTISFILIPIISIFSQVSISKTIPLGPLDIHILFNDKTVLIISFIITVILSSGYSSSIRLYRIVHENFKNPCSALFMVASYSDKIKYLLGIPKTIFEGIYGLVPTDVFFLVGMRFYFTEKFSDSLIDMIFVGVIALAAIMRIFITKQCAQFVILLKSFSAIKALDEERSIDSWKKAVRTNIETVETLPNNFIAFLAPSFVNIFLALLFGYSYFVSDELAPYLRILTIYALSSSEITQSMQQLVPESL